MTYYLPGMNGTAPDPNDEDERDRIFKQLIDQTAGAEPSQKPALPASLGKPEDYASDQPAAPPVPDDNAAPSDDPEPVLQRQRPTPQLSAADFPSDDSSAPQTRVEATGRSMQGHGDPLEDAFRAKLLKQLTEGDEPTEAPKRQMADSGSALNGGTLGALLLDAFVNHGRGGGQIVGATVNNIDKDRRAEQEHLDKVAEAEARRKNAKDPMASYIGLGNLNARNYEDTAVKAPNAQLGRDRFESTVDPNNADAKGKLQLTEAASVARTKGRLDETHTHADDIAGDHALVTKARDEQIHEDAPIRSSDLASQALERLQKTGPQRVQEKVDTAGMIDENRDVIKARDEERKRQAAADAAAKGKPQTPQQALAADKEDSRLATQFTDKTKYELDAAKQLRGVEGVIGKYENGQLPGIGTLAGMEPTKEIAARDTLADFVGSPDAKAKDILKIRNLQDYMANEKQRVESGAAAPVDEQLGYRIRQGAQSGASEEQFRDGVAAYKEALTGRLKAYRVGKEKMADRVLQSQGIDNAWLGVQDEAPTAAAVSGAPPERLNVTGGSKVRDTPALPQSALDDQGNDTGAEETKQYRFKGPSGQWRTVPLTAAEYQLKSKHMALEAL